MHFAGLKYEGSGSYWRWPEQRLGGVGWGCLRCEIWEVCNLQFRCGCMRWQFCKLGCKTVSKTVRVHLSWVCWWLNKALDFWRLFGESGREVFIPPETKWSQCWVCECWQEPAFVYVMWTCVFMHRWVWFRTQPATELRDLLWELVLLFPPLPFPLQQTRQHTQHVSKHFYYLERTLTSLGFISEARH